MCTFFLYAKMFDYESLSNEFSLKTLGLDSQINFIRKFLFPIVLKYIFL